MQEALYRYHSKLVAKPISFLENSSRQLPRQGRSYNKIHVVLWVVFLSLSICNAHYNPIGNNNNNKKVSLVSSNTSFQRSPQEWRSYYSQQRSRYNSRSFGTIDYSTKFLSMDEVKHDRRARIFNVDFKRRRNHMSITSRIIWITLLAFGVQVWKPRITELGMKISDRILRGEQLYRLVTPILLHGGLLHLGTNMISLQRVGNDVEKLFGPNRYLSLYIASGVCGNLMSAWRSPNPSLGASGSVFGIVGAYFVKSTCLKL